MLPIQEENSAFPCFGCRALRPFTFLICFLNIEKGKFLQCLAPAGPILNLRVKTNLYLSYPKLSIRNRKILIFIKNMEDGVLVCSPGKLFFKMKLKNARPENLYSNQ